MGILKSTFAATTLIFSPISAQAATLVGATISEQYVFPDLGTNYADTTYIPQSFSVGAGQESAIVLEGVTTFNVNFSSSSLALVFDTSLSNPTFAAAPFNGLVFTSAAFTQFMNVTVNGTTNFAGFDASRASLVGNELRINWSGLSYDTNTVLELDFSSAVPEPATWALMLFGFGAVGASMRARPNKALLPITR